MINVFITYQLISNFICNDHCIACIYQLIFNSSSNDHGIDSMFLYYSNSCNCCRCNDK